VALDHASLSAALGRTDFAPTDQELQQVAACCGADLTVPLNFAVTAAPHRTGAPVNTAAPQTGFAESPQTTQLVQTFGLGLDFRTQHGVTSKRRRQPSSAAEQRAAAAGLLDAMPPVGADEEIDLGDD
tara:strand:- start:204 stop:587 length:384 start_codon:yes stop_codon:yes gene_type:complete